MRNFYAAFEPNTQDSKQKYTNVRSTAIVVDLLARRARCITHLLLSWFLSLTLYSRSAYMSRGANDKAFYQHMHTLIYRRREVRWCKLAPVEWKCLTGHCVSGLSLLAEAPEESTFTQSREPCGHRRPPFINTRGISPQPSKKRSGIDWIRLFVFAGKLYIRYLKVFDMYIRTFFIQLRFKPKWTAK